jgi:hypothetical protein
MRGDGGDGPGRAQQRNELGMLLHEPGGGIGQQKCPQMTEGDTGWGFLPVFQPGSAVQKVTAWQSQLRAWVVHECG